MDFYGRRVKKWKFNATNIEEKRQEMKQWREKWKHKYDMQEIFVNNAFAIEYKLLLKM